MTQAYIEGFTKIAEAYGVDPQELLKIAQQGLGVVGPRVDTANFESFRDSILNPTYDIAFEKNLPSEGLLRYLGGIGHENANNHVLRQAHIKAQVASSMPKVKTQKIGIGLSPVPPQRKLTAEQRAARLGTRVGAAALLHKFK